MYAEEIINAPSDPAALRLAVQSNAAESYVSKCNEMKIT
jgi:hypothetical protein